MLPASSERMMLPRQANSPAAYSHLVGNPDHRVITWRRGALGLESLPMMTPPPFAGPADAGLGQATRITDSGRHPDGIIRLVASASLRNPCDGGRQKFPPVRPYRDAGFVRSHIRCRRLVGEKPMNQHPFRRCVPVLPASGLPTSFQNGPRCALHPPAIIEVIWYAVIDPAPARGLSTS